MDRNAAIAERIVRNASSFEQGWYESRRTGMIALWTQYVGSDKVISFVDLENLRERAEKTTKETASILGKKIQHIFSEVLSINNKPAVYATGVMIASPSDMEGIKERRP